MQKEDEADMERLRRISWPLAIAYALAIGLLAPRVWTIATAQAAPQAQLTVGANIKTEGGGQILGLAGATGSFGFNARRPANFDQSTGEAVGRLNYNRHTVAGNHHVNVPITLMSGEFDPGTNTGRAILVGDCAQGECPSTTPATTYVLADVSDQGEPGTNDSFRILTCTDTKPTVAPTNTNACVAVTIEGGVIQRGNIQVRGG